MLEDSACRDTLTASTASSVSLPLIGGTWDRYEILALLGKGGMGAVYKARDRHLGRIVALKFILGDDPQLIKRFIQEARAQARIEHSNVCKVYEVGEFEGRSFIAMQFIEGQPLSVMHRQLSLEQKVALLTSVAEAVHAAHRQGVIHRDLKPGNIMIERTEESKWRPVVMDFGLAQDTTAAQALTQAGAPLGTPQYMPPEQARGDIQRIDRRSDVYGLGAVLYELLTGVPPFIGETVMDLLLQVLEREPVPPRQRVSSLPLDLETIALKCLQKEPTQRYDSARALADDLRRYLDGEPVRARPTSIGYRALRWARKRPAVVALAGALIVGSALSGGMVVRAQRRAQAVARELEAQAQLAVQLGQDVKEMELFMRVGYMMPRHDVGPQKEVVRERMRQIEQRAAKLPVARRGAAQYALGRGHLALREYKDALEKLQAAWDHGYRAPEVSYALGRSLGEQYKLEVAEVERASDAGYRQRERQKLERTYLAPARQLLSQASSAALESPDYVQGLIALYSQQNEEAIRRAAAALRNHPWQYEAHVLAGDAWTRLGVVEQDRGQLGQGRKDFERAIVSYGQAADLARSDASVYESEASAWTDIIDNVNQQGGDPRTAYERGLLACDHAIEVAPNDLNAYEKKLRVYERWGNHLFFLGENLSTIVDSADRTLAQALRLGQVSAMTYDAMGILEAYMSNYQIAHGLDPRRNIAQARAHFQQAIAVNSNFAWPWNDSGGVEAIDFDWLARHGGTFDELSQHLAGAVLMIKRAAEIDPNYIVAYESLLELYSRQAKMAILVGQNPDAPIRETLWARDRGLQLSDQDFMIFNNFAAAQGMDARYRYLSNRDPGPALEVVYKNIAQALRLKADYSEHYQNLAEAHLIAASYALAIEGDVLAEVTTGLQALRDRAQHSPNDARDEALRIRLLLVRTRWLLAQGKSVSADWQEVVAAATRALKLDAEDPDVRLAHAESVRYRVELGAISGPPAMLLIEQGLDSADKGLRQQPWNTFLQAARSALWLMRGRVTLNDAERQVWSEKGRSALTAVLKQNPLLGREYGVLLEPPAKALRPS